LVILQNTYTGIYNDIMILRKINSKSWPERYLNSHLCGSAAGYTGIYNDIMIIYNDIMILPKINSKSWPERDLNSQLRGSAAGGIALYSLREFVILLVC
jgi:hypothetical protein